VLLFVACARTPQPAEPPARGELAAARLYAMAEGSLRLGRHDQALGLFRQAFLVARDDESTTGLRNAVVARMAETLIDAHQRDGGDRHLALAEQILVRYLEHGVSDERAKMGLEVVLSRVREHRKAAAVARAGTRARDATPPDHTGELDVHAGEVLDKGGVAREVEVRDTPFARLDDPRVRAYFAGDFLGESVFADRPPRALNPPRILLRYGPAWTNDSAPDEARRSARADVRDLLVRNRDALVDCYLSAMGREPIFTSRLVLDVALDEHGTIAELGVSAGSLVDARGNLCMIDTLRADPALARATGESVTIHTPMTFFFQPPRGVSEFAPYETAESVGTGSKTPSVRIGR
jgi:hypothetical protein